MKILLVGGGGREHALAWKISQSPLVEKLFCAPGNAGMAALGELVAISDVDVEALCGFAQEALVDLVVVGPEAALAAGLADKLREVGIPCFGPDKAAAQLEASKGFMKDLCREHNIPTAAYGRFSEAEAAKVFLRTLPAPYVVKADGLAAGKGVIIAQNLQDAEAAVESMFDGEFGAAGAEVVIEEFLPGEEASFFAVTDGETILPMIGSQDHKRAFDGDEGPNTGGMGAYSPAPVFTDEIQARVMTEIVEPTVRAMREQGAPYKGVLYAGLMIGEDGPKLIEYNVRFGDPECQVMMRRMESDIVPVLMAVATGTLAGHAFEWSSDAAALVVLAAKGYPGSYQKGTAIAGLDDAGGRNGIEVFHAGTKFENGQLVSNGGRVLNVTSTGEDGREAVERAYAALEDIDWPDGFCRRDIGWRMLERDGA